MKLRRWLGSLAAAVISTPLLFAQTPDISLPRPGAVVVTQLTGTATVASGDQRRPIKVDERLRVGSTLSTGRKSFLGLTLSNGSVIELGPESELEIEEFGQSPVSGSVKFAELTAEPTLSKTRLRLLRGDATVVVKPLKVARGSSFQIAIPAGTVRLGDGTVRAVIRMSDVGLGVCTLELQKGAADYEPPGGAFAPMPPGRKLAFALEVDKVSGEIKVGEMPKATPPKK